MPTRRVLFHCNADTRTGLGHFMRCLAVAEEALARRWQVTFAGSLDERARTVAAELIPAATIEPLLTDEPAAELERIVAAIQPDVVHLDSYDPRLDHAVLPAQVISNAQDGRFGRRAATLHIDANLFAEERCTASADDSMLLGTEAMQIRRQVRAIQHHVRHPLTAPLHVLLVLGGTDPLNRTPAVVRALSGAGVPLDLTVVCREAQHTEVSAAFNPSVGALTLLAFVEDLPALANAHDLAITGAGTSTWDFAAMGLPIALLSIVDNHEEGYEASSRAGIVLPLGSPTDDVFEHTVHWALKTARTSTTLDALSAHAKKQIDGLGCWRIVSAWETLLTGPAAPAPPETTLSARPATLDDAHTLFAWRNDPVTRAASRNQEPVAWQDHLRWLTGSLDNPDRRLLVCEDSGVRIGTARWDRLDHRSWEVSITLAPEARGKRLARAVLLAAERMLDTPDPVRLVAAVHEGNRPSQRLFARAGYLPSTPSDEQGFAGYSKWRLRPDPR